MDYGKIVSTGFSQAWRHKSLWILGFFVSGGAGDGLFNIKGDEDFLNFGDLGRFGRFDFYDIKQFLFDNPLIIAAAIAAVLFLILIMIILGTISTGGLIEAARRFKVNEQYRFGTVFGVGVSFFWPILAIGILMFIVIGAFIIVLALFGVAAFMMHTGIGILALLVLIPLALIGIFVAVITAAMGERIIVIEKKGVFDSIADGFNLWRSNLGSSIVYSLLYIAIAIGVAIGTFVIIMFIVMPFIAIGFMNLLLALLTGIPLILLVLLVVDGFTSAAMHLMTTEFYYQLKLQSSPAPIPASDFPSGPDQSLPPSSQPPPPEGG